MKVELGIKWCWMILLLFLCFSSKAQETIKFENGSFELLIRANYNGVSAVSKVPSSNPNGVTLNYEGVENPQLQFRVQNVKWDGIDGAGLVIKSNWVSNSSGINKVTARDITLKRSSHKKPILFKPKSNGKQTITIKYAVLKSGEDVNTLQPSGNAIVKNITVKGLKDDTPVANTTSNTENVTGTDSEKINKTKEPTANSNNNQKTEVNQNSTWPVGLTGNNYSFGEGKVQVRLSAGNDFFSMGGPSTVNVANNNNKQLTLQLSNLEWKDPTKPGTLVIRPNWLFVSNNTLAPMGFNGIELRQNQTKTIPIKIKANGDGFVRLQFGYRSADGTFFGPEGPGIDKSLKVTGFGNETANQEEPGTANTANPAVNTKLVAEDENAWKKAKEENTFLGYLAYWNQYRNNGKYIRECGFLISKINIDYEFIEQKETTEGKEYLINLNNVIRFTIDTADSEGLITEIIDDNNIRAVVTDGKKHILKVLGQFRRNVEIELDPKSQELKADFEEGEKGNIKFQISGGKKPYYLILVDVNTKAEICVIGQADTTTNELNKDNIYASCLKKLDGQYKLAVKDRRKSIRVVSENSFVLKTSENKGILSYLWVLLLVLLIPIGIIIKKNL